MTTTLIIGLLIPLLGTMLGSAFVFFMRDEMSVRLQKSLLGFASGVMVAASVWSLLIPAMEMEVNSGKWAVFPAAVGFLLGMGFLLLIDELTPHLHIGTDKPEGLHSHLSKTAMLALAVTIACRWQQPLALVPDWFSERCCRTHRCYCRSITCFFHYARSPLHARLCSRRHVLRRGRGTHP